MRKADTIRAAIIPVLTLLCTAAFSQPAVDPATGRAYEFVEVPGGISWTDARDAAALRVFGGTTGHLATITSDAERDFVFSMLTGTGPGKAWLGGSQVACVPPETEPDCGWTWVTGEPFDYTNWAPGQPDDINAGNKIALNLANSTWSDEVDSATATDGYLVEYPSGTVLASTCIGAFCSPSGANWSTRLPDGTVVDENDVVIGHLVEFAAYDESTGPCEGPWARIDPRVNGGTGLPHTFEPLNVGPLTTGEIGDGELIISNKHYGNPCFAVMIADTTVPFFFGGIQSIQDPTGIPGIGPVTGCDDPDLQQRSQHLYQTNPITLMPEGVAEALTSLCNSPSLAVIGRVSFLPLNTKEHRGIPSSDVEAINQAFQNELIAKADLLRARFESAKASLLDPKPAALKRHLDRLRSQLKFRQFDKALIHITDFLQANADASWDPNDLSNPEGELASRGENVRYRIEELN